MQPNDEQKKILESLNSKLNAGTNTGKQDRLFLAWMEKEHYLDAPLVHPHRIPPGYFQYWDDKELRYKVAPGYYSDDYGIITDITNHSIPMEEEQTTEQVETTEEVSTETEST